MREIKFRVWDKVNKELILSENILKICFIGETHFPNCIVVSDKEISHFGDVDMINKTKLNDFILMQYTGLKDTNGKEIYEGDIIHTKGHYSGEGWFDTGECDYDFDGIVEYDNLELTYMVDGFNLSELDRVKVIGNIYENPELVERGKKMNKIQKHKQICMELTNTYERKNNDYGDSFAKLRKDYPNAILIRLADKYERLKSLKTGTKQQVSDESIKDTLLDLANYCIMEVVEMESEEKSLNKNCTNPAEILINLIDKQHNMGITIIEVDNGEQN